MKRFVIYIRVSTKQQGASGLGLEAQQRICNDFIKAHEGECVAEFKDVESGTHRNRKGLTDAVAYCKKNECALVIAKLDRLARDVEFCFRIVNTGIEIHFCDMPQVNTLLLGVFASVAQYERELTSARTTSALAAKKERGEKTGGASDKWIAAYKNKSKEQKERESMKRGQTKNERYLNSRDVVAFMRILRNVFPEQCAKEDASEWDWKNIGTKGDAKEKILHMMKDYKDMDESGMLFRKWDFSKPFERLRSLIATNICNIRTAVMLNKRNKEENVYE